MHRIAEDSRPPSCEQGERLCVAPTEPIRSLGDCHTARFLNAGTGLALHPTPRRKTELAPPLKVFSRSCDETSDFLPRWENRVSQYQVSGKSLTTPASLAAMMVHGSAVS